MALRIITILGLVLTLGACSIQKDVPEFVYPTSGVDPNGAFPQLLSVDQLASQGTSRIEPDTQSLDSLSARVAGLRARASVPPVGGSSTARIADLRKRAAILRNASF
jgi:hypothetical protein